MSKSIIIVMMVALCLPSAVSAETVIVTLNTIEKRVLEENPDIAAARLKIQEAIGRMNQSGRLKNPALESSVERGTQENEHKLELGISQQFPLTNRLSLEKDISQAELKAAEEEVRDVERVVTAQAKLLLLEVLEVRERTRLAQEQLDIMNHLVKYLQELAERAEGSKLDVGQAQLEVASLKMKLHHTREDELSLVGELKPYLGMAAKQRLSVSGEMPIMLMPESQVDVSKRPDYLVAQLEADAAKREVELEKSKRYEDVEAGVFGSIERYEDAPVGIRNESMVGVQFKLPLPLWNRNEGSIQEAEARSQRKQLAVNRLAREIGVEAHTAYLQMEECHHLIKEIDEELLPLAAEQVKLNDQAHKDGQVDIQSVLRASAKHLEIQSARAEAVAEFHRARIRYEAAIGK